MSIIIINIITPITQPTIIPDVELRPREDVIVLDFGR